MSTKSILAVSLCVNVGLAAAFLFKSPPAQVEVTAKASVKPSSASRAEKKDKSSAATAEPIKVIQQVDWRVVESEDYKKYITNLRAIGCPEETIKDIILADVNKLYDAKRKALKKPEEGFKFWKGGMNQMMGAMMNEEKQKQQKELATEKKALLKELLGIEVEEKADVFGITSVMETMLDFLPPAKQAKVIELMQDMQTKAMKRMGNGQPDAEDMKEIQKLQKESEAELAKLLTPQEKEDYDLRLSQTSMMMRMQMTDFEPNEQEFRDIFKLRKKFDDEFGGQFGMMSQDKEEQAKRATAQKELDGQLKTMMGDARYADYQRGQDWAYGPMSKVAERQGLPKEAAVKVYDMKKAAEEQATKLRMDQSLSNEQRQTALRAIRMETERAITTTFGQKGFESYKSQQGAWWLNGLSPDAPTPVPTK